MKIFYSMIIEGDKILKYAIGFGAPSHIISSPEDLNYAKTFNHILRIETKAKGKIGLQRYDLRFRDVNSAYDLEDLENWINEVSK